MPDVLDPAWDDDTGPVVAQGGDPSQNIPDDTTNLPVDIPQVSNESGNALNSSQPTDQVTPPPTWNDISSNPLFQKFDDEQKKVAFKKWVSDSNAFLNATNTPVQNKAVFSNYVQKESPNYGMSFIFNPDQTPMTIAQEAAIRGRPLTDEEKNATAHGDSYVNSPFTEDIVVPKQGILPEIGRNVSDYVKAVTDIGTKAIPEAVSAAYRTESNLSVGILPSLSAASGRTADKLDAGLAVADLIDKEQQAKDGSQTTGEWLATGAGHLAATFPARGYMGAVAGTQAADETYHSEVDQGVPPWKAAQSAGVAGMSTAALFAIMGPASNMVAKTVLGSKAPLYLAGGLKPTVSEAAKIMGLDYTALGAANVGAGIIQNAADREIYDPERPLLQGAVPNFFYGGAFSLAHGPELLASFRNYSTDLRAADTEVQNAAAQIRLATKGGDTDAVASAQKAYTVAKDKFDGIVSDAVKNTKPPSEDDIAQANALKTADVKLGSPLAAPADPIDALIDQTEQEVAKPPELPVTGETVPTDADVQASQPAPITLTEEKPADVEAKPEAVDTPEPIPKVQPTAQEAVESSIPAEQGTVPQGETAANSTKPIDNTVNLEGLDRPALEKVAADEGHTSDDIAFAKTDEDLRGLIESHRAGQEITPSEGLTTYGDGSKIDPKIEKLPTLFKTVAKTFVNAAKKWGLRGVNKFVVDTREGSRYGDVSIFARPRDGNFDTVYINPVALARETEDLKSRLNPDGNRIFSDADINHLHQLRFSEEFEHNIGGRVISDEWKKNGGKGAFSYYYDKKMASVYDQMTQKARKSLQKRYKGDLEDIDIKKDSTDIGNAAASRMGEEYLREILQRRGGKGVTEDAIQAVRNNKPMRSIIKGIVTKLQAVVDKLSATGKSDTVLEQLIAERNKLLGEEASKVESTLTEGKSKISKSASLTPDENESKEGNASNPRNAEDGKRLVEEAHQGSPGTGADLLRGIAGAGTEGPIFESERQRQIAAYQSLTHKLGKGLSWNFFQGMKELVKGGEHTVYQKGDRVYKVVREPNEFGTGFGMDYESTPYDYLHRLNLSNKIFGDDLKWEGGIQKDGKISTVTSQRYLNGTEPTVDEAGKYMEARGFREVPGAPDTWYRAKDDMLVGDAKTRNFIKTEDGKVHAIDLIPKEATPELKKGLGIPDSKQASKSSTLDFDYGKAMEESVSKQEDKSDEEKTRYEQSQEKWNKRLQEVKDVELPGDTQEKLHELTSKMAKFQFGTDAGNRDIAEGNAFFKVMVQAREWAKEYGSFNATNPEGKKFSATQIIRNSLLDDGRYAARRANKIQEASIQEPEKVAESEEGAEAVTPQPKGIDMSETDPDANQAAFEGTGEPSNGEVPIEETPRSKINNANVDSNIKKVFGDITPYEHRLLELANDDPKTWAKDAADEFGLSEPQVKKDMSDLQSKVEKNISQNGLGKHDFQRMSGATPLTEEDRPAYPSSAAAIAFKDAKTWTDHIRAAIGEFTRLSKYTDWVKSSSEFGRRIAQAVQHSNEVYREFSKLLPDKTISGGVIRYIEAGGDRATLEKWVKQTAKNPETKHLTPYYEAALNLTPEQIAAAGKVTRMLEATRQLAKTWGIDIPKRPNYFPREVVKGDDIHSFGHGDNLNVSFKHGKQRTHDTMFDGEQNGIMYKNNDAAVGLSAYVLDLRQAVNARKFVASLAKGIEADGRKMLAPSQSSWNSVTNPENGQVHMVMDKMPDEKVADYRTLDIPALRNWSYAGELNGNMVMHRSDMLVHPKLADKLGNVFGSTWSKLGNLPGWWRSSSDTSAEAISKRITKFFLNDINAVAKSNLFSIASPFHQVQISMEAAGHGVNPQVIRALKDASKYLPSDTLRGLEGVKPPDFNDTKVQDAMNHSLELKPEEVDINAEGGTNLDNTFLHWNEMLAKKLGKTPEAIAKYLKDANADAQTWLFQKFIPAMKMASYERDLTANTKLYAKELASGEYTMDQVKYQTAKATNYAYGHLNYRVMARNPTIQALLRTLLLAPDFFEARARHLGQAMQGAVGLKSGRANFKPMLYLSMALIASAQVANTVMNGSPDWTHPFEARVGNRYYGARSSPGDAYNLFKDSYSLVSGKGAGLPYLSNRASPLTRFVTEAATGRNWRGEKINAYGAITDLIAGSVPMPAQGLVSKIPGADKIFSTSANNTISPFETALGSMGVKVSRYSPILAMKTQAHDFVNSEAGAKAGLKANTTVYPTSVYRPMEFALEDGDFKSAYAEYQKLLVAKDNNPAKLGSGLRQSLMHPFTGTPRGDVAFYKSLNDHDKTLFTAAKQRQQLLLQRYQNMLKENRK